MLRFFAITLLALFSVAPAVAAPKETVFLRFSGQVGKGAFPAAGLISDANGNLYGTTFEGGSSNRGTIYKMTPPWKESVIYTFTGANDGQNPYVALTIDASGNLYGAAQRGRFSNSSTIFKLSPNGDSWTFNTICSFDPAQFGAVYIGSSLTLDSAGNLYGEAARGGQTTDGFVYQLTPPVRSGDPWGATILYTFQGALNEEDGAWPSGGLALDSQGNLYGTTELNGYPFKCNRAGCGTVFELSPPAHQGGAWKENVLYRFQNKKDGAQPGGGVIRDAGGNLYGTASYGGDRLKDGWSFNWRQTETARGRSLQFMLSPLTRKAPCFVHMLVLRWTHRVICSVRRSSAEISIAAHLPSVAAFSN
jgi:uncharacterized repeat protein (TIGR03803 family)